MKTTKETLDTAIQTLRDLRDDFAETNDPAVRLAMWARMKSAMELTKAVEMEFRKECFGAYFPDHTKGTKNLELGGGYVLKGVAELNYNVDKEKVDDTLDGIERLGERGKLYAESIVKFKPELSVTEYKKLLESNDPTDKNILALIQSIITTSPGSPTLTIVPPKSAT